MISQASKHAPLETGGILLGYLSDEGSRREAVVQQIIGPGPAALHGRSRFIPDGPWQREKLAEVFTKSRGLITYLGDWHSHPDGTGTPSRLDQTTARKISRRRRARAARPLMAIVYPGSVRDWEITVHCYDGTALRSISLNRFMA
jgi:integrative and conjugative element protein (TIGR02256 family)